MWEYARFKFETIANSMGESKETLRRLFITDELAVNLSSFGDRVCFRALGKVNSYFNPSKMVKDIYPFSTLARIPFKSQVELGADVRKNIVVTIARLNNRLSSQMDISTIHGRNSAYLNLDVDFISYKERLYTILLSTIQLLYVKYS